MVDLLGLWLGIIKCIHFKEVLMSCRRWHYDKYCKYADDIYLHLTRSL